MSRSLLLSLLATAAAVTAIAALATLHAAPLPPLTTSPATPVTHTALIARESLGLANACSMTLSADGSKAYVGLCNRYGLARNNLIVVSLDALGKVVGAPRAFVDSTSALGLGQFSSVTAIHLDESHHKLFLGVLQGPSTTESLYYKKPQRAELDEWDLDSAGLPMGNGPTAIFVDAEDAARMSYKPVFVNNPIEAIVRHPTKDLLYVSGSGTNDGAHANLVVLVSLAQNGSGLANVPNPVRPIPIAARDQNGGAITRYKSGLAIAAVPDPAKPAHSIYRLYLGTYHDPTMASLHRCTSGSLQPALEIVSLDEEGMPAPAMARLPQETFLWGPCQTPAANRSFPLRFDLTTLSGGTPRFVTRRASDVDPALADPILEVALSGSTGAPISSKGYSVTPYAESANGGASAVTGVFAIDAVSTNAARVAQVHSPAQLQASSPHGNHTVALVSDRPPSPSSTSTLHLGWTASIVFTELVGPQGSSDGHPFVPTKVLAAYGREKLTRALKQPIPLQSAQGGLTATLHFDEPDLDLANPVDPCQAMPWGEQHVVFVPKDDKGNQATRLTATLTLRDGNGRTIGEPQTDTVKGPRMVFVLPTYDGFQRGAPAPESLAAHFERFKKVADSVAVKHAPKLFLTSFSHTRGGQGSMRELVAQRELVKELGINTTEVQGWDGLGADGTTAREFSSLYMTATASVPYDGRFANRPFNPSYLDEVGDGHTYMAHVLPDLAAAADGSACGMMHFLVRTGSLADPVTRPGESARTICQVPQPQVRIAGIGDEPNLQMPDEIEMMSAIPRRLHEFRAFVQGVACARPTLPYRDSTLRVELSPLVPHLDCKVDPQAEGEKFDVAWARIFPVPPSAIENAQKLGLTQGTARRLVFWTAQFLFYEDAVAFKALADDLRRKTSGTAATPDPGTPGASTPTPGLLATLNIQGFQKYLQTYDNVTGAMRASTGPNDRIIVQLTKAGGANEAEFTVSRGALSASAKLPPMPPQSVNARPPGNAQLGIAMWYPPIGPARGSAGTPGLMPLLFDTQHGRFRGDERFEINMGTAKVSGPAGYALGASPWVSLSDKYVCSVDSATRHCGVCSQGLRSTQDAKLKTTRTDGYDCQDLRMLRPDMFAAARIRAFNPSYELAAADSEAEHASFTGAMLRSIASGYDVGTQHDRTQTPVSTMAQYIVNGGSLGETADGALYKILAMMGQGAKGFQFYGFGAIDAFGDSWGEHTETYKPIAHALDVLGRTEAIAWRGVPDRAEVAVVVPNDDFLWDPWHNTPGYTNYYSKEPQALYYALSHSGYGADFIDEQELKQTGAEKQSTLLRRGYKVLYLVGPNLSLDSARVVYEWMSQPGHTLVVLPGAATRNEYDEPLRDPKLGDKNPVDVLLGLKARKPHRELFSEVNVWPPLGADATLTFAEAARPIFGAGVGKANGQNKLEIRGCIAGGCGTGVDNRPSWSFNFADDLTPDPQSKTAARTLATLTTNDPTKTFKGTNAITLNRPNGNIAMAYSFFPGFQYLGSADSSSRHALPTGWSESRRKIAVAPVSATAGVMRAVEVSHTGVEALRLRWPDEKEPLQHVAVVLLNWSGEPIEAPVTVKISGLAGGYRVSAANDTPLEPFVEGSGKVVLKRLDTAEVLLLEK